MRHGKLASEAWETRQLGLGNSPVRHGKLASEVWETRQLGMGNSPLRHGKLASKAWETRQCGMGNSPLRHGKLASEAWETRQRGMKNSPERHGKLANEACFVSFCFVKNALARVVLVPSRRLPIFSSVVRFPYLCITRSLFFIFAENFHVFFNLYRQRKQNNLARACTGRYLFWFFSCLSRRCCLCCGLIIVPVLV